MSTSVTYTPSTIVVSRRRPVPYIIWLAIGIHVVWGASMVWDPLVAPAAILVGMHWILAMGIDGRLLGVLLVFAAMLAVAALILEQRLGRITDWALLLPQYILLIGAFVSDSESVITSTVAGRVVDRTLLFDALWPMMLTAVLHSVSIIDRYRTWTRRA